MSNKAKPYSKAKLTQQHIIDTAKKLFIKEGFNTISMEKIAQSAQINHSLIYYHFKTKDNLWNAVKQSIVESANQDQPIIPALSLPWDSFLKTLLERQLNFYQQYPEVQQMIMLQRIENKTPSKTKSATAQQWIDAIEYYQQQGHINSELSPAYVTCFIISIISSMALDHQPIIEDSNSKNSYLDTCFDIIKKGLR